jgi:hypothetical protein
MLIAVIWDDVASLSAAELAGIFEFKNIVRACCLDSDVLRSCLYLEIKFSSFLLFC